ncbi:MAG: lipase maturation factor family protein [Candidatus Obscuribacterales bacterium]|nr:lipase maturation factor family protein [Candidatus Obscuribacterales bacterium]
MSGDGRIVKATESYALMRWLFLRMLGIVYIVAFLSLCVQMKGLIGSNGILPAHILMETAGKAGVTFWQLPTVAWINSSDTALQLIPLIGALAALLVTLGFFTAPALALCWLFYLSIMTIGGDFLMFQWDILLLETGFLSIFFAPWQWYEFPWKIRGKEGAFGQPPRIILFLIRLLLFRLLFESGLCKLASGDQTWQNLTALTYHYQTQPLPTPLAWFGNQLPLWFQQFSCGFVFFEELLVPLLVFAPYRFRLIAAGLMFFLQFLIASTGNYAFFNLLTVVLIFSLLDDAAISRLMPASIRKQTQQFDNTRGPKKTQRAASYVCLGLLMVIVLCHFTRSVSPFGYLREQANEILALSAPYQFFNRYGLFAIMTTSRPEIIIEGSEDGNVWKEYEFYFKPGNVKCAPPIVAPYQPRLDWQMWFAALSDYGSNPWFMAFVRRLLDGQPDVLALLKTNPFPDKPPHYIRAMTFDYRFTGFDEQKATGAWWHRVAKGVYFPVATLGSN